MERRPKNPDFNKTQPINVSLEQQIPNFTRESELLLALHMVIPYDGSDPEVPTKVLDGRVVIDMDALRDVVTHAIKTRDTSDVPNILGIPKAVENIIEANNTPESAAALHPNFNADTVREALRPIPKNPLLGETQVIDLRRPEQPPTVLH